MSHRPIPSDSAAIQAKTHPFPVLLYLEWTLLGLVLISQLLPNPFGDLLPRLKFASLFCTIGFGLTGLWLPRRPLFTQVGYVGLQMILMLGSIGWGGLRGLRLAPLLCVVLALRSCLMFKLPGRVITIAIAYLLFLVLLIARLSSLPVLPLPRLGRGIERPLIGLFAFNSALLLILVLILVLLLVNALLTERQRRDELAAAHAQLRRYALQVEQLAMVQERNRIGREIHDSLGHALTALNLQLEGALKLWQTHPNRSYSFLQTAKTLGSEALQAVRQAVAATRSDPLQGKPLPEAIASLVQEFQRTTQIQPLCQIQLETSLPLDLSTALYRIIQEALTNICKHAQATQMQIQLQEQPTQLILTIQDNGRGFEPEQNPTGFGLQGMRERAMALGGQVDLESRFDQGCRITVWLPLPDRSPSADL